VPPSQCPACGRFLRNALVESLAARPVPCPGCGEPLAAAMFPGPMGPTRYRASAADAAGGRPPDAQSGEAAELDPLAGWDRGVGADEVAGWRLDEPPVPVDGLIVLGSGLAGGLLGLVLADRRRGRAAAAGTLLGVLGAGLARGVWRLPG